MRSLSLSLHNTHAKDDFLRFRPAPIAQKKKKIKKSLSPTTNFSYLVISVISYNDISRDCFYKIYIIQYSLHKVQIMGYIGIFLG